MTAAPTAPAKLKGQELLDFVKANAGRDRDEVVREAGYVAFVTDPETKEKRESLQLSRFNEAFMEASGVVLTRPKGTPRPGTGLGKKVAFRITVGTKGVLPVGAPYTERAGLTPGSFVLVSFDKETNTITLELDPCQEKGVDPEVNENGAIGVFNEPTSDATPATPNGKSAKPAKVAVAA